MAFLDNIDLIVFDLDGTLVDSRFDLADAVNHAMQQLGRPLLSYEALPPLLGSGLSYLLKEAAGTDDPEMLTKAKRHFDDYYAEHFVTKTKPYPGVMDTLRALKPKKTAIYSNKLQHFTGRIAEALKMAPLMDVVQGANPDAYPLKPHPAGLQRILDQLQVPADRALMVGDSTHDIEAAKAAGMYTCAVTYGYRPRAVLAEEAPDYFVDQFPELLDL
ncbi:MAG: HAD-IA family hydrolase [Phaeodactylibacter sp.]|uniref:HAD family hydrolase n=1 Tax=Phaeodactylibacter sp. TaxID=1940289 RepID=UPI0032EB5830